MLRVRFDLNIKNVDDDYRPVKWPVKYPYWFSGENDTYFHLIAYVEDLNELYNNWPEAEHVHEENVDKIEFTDRFPKPKWYNE